MSHHRCCCGQGVCECLDSPANLCPGVAAAPVARQCSRPTLWLPRCYALGVQLTIRQAWPWWQGIGVQNDRRAKNEVAIDVALQFCVSISNLNDPGGWNSGPRHNANEWTYWADPGAQCFRGAWGTYYKLASAQVAIRFDEYMVNEFASDFDDAVKSGEYLTTDAEDVLQAWFLAGPPILGHGTMQRQLSAAPDDVDGFLQQLMSQGGLPSPSVHSIRMPNGPIGESGCEAQNSVTYSFYANGAVVSDWQASHGACGRQASMTGAGSGEFQLSTGQTVTENATVSMEYSETITPVQTSTCGQCAANACAGARGQSDPNADAIERFNANNPVASCPGCGQ